MDDDDEQRKEVLIVRELFKGRFNDAEMRILMEHFNWNKDDVIKFVLENEPSDVTDLIRSKSESNVKDIQSDGELVRNAKIPQILCVTRLFACQDCDRDWWRKVPTRKQVSKCFKCKRKYDPVPKNEEWGWALFDCNCGNSFSGFGRQGLQSECFKCHANVSPTHIGPGPRNRAPRSHKPHSCDAADCWNKSLGEYPRNLPGPALYNPGIGGGHKHCVHPKSRQGQKRVLYASLPHHSTGSTVDTCVPQDKLDDLPFRPSLGPIGEDDDDSGSDGDNDRPNSPHDGSDLPFSPSLGPIGEDDDDNGSDGGSKRSNSPHGGSESGNNSS